MYNYTISLVSRVAYSLPFRSFHGCPSACFDAPLPPSATRALHPSFSLHLDHVALFGLAADIQKRNGSGRTPKERRSRKKRSKKERAIERRKTNSPEETAVEMDVVGEQRGREASRQAASRQAGRQAGKQASKQASRQTGCLPA